MSKYLDPIQIGDTMDTFRVIWADGLNRRPNHATNNTPLPPKIPFGARVEIVEYFVPEGKTPAQERWGKLEGGLWIALVYDGKVRAEIPKSTPDPAPLPAVTVHVIAAGYETVVVELRPKDRKF